MVTETYGIPSMRMDSEMTSIEASLCLTRSWKELDNINNQTPLWYMDAFFSTGIELIWDLSSFFLYNFISIISNICILMFAFIMQLHYVIKSQIFSIQVPNIVPLALA